MGNFLQMLESSKTAQRNTKITELGGQWLSTLGEEAGISRAGSWERTPWRWDPGLRVGPWQAALAMWVLWGEASWIWSSGSEGPYLEPQLPHLRLQWGSASVAIRWRQQWIIGAKWKATDRVVSRNSPQKGRRKSPIPFSCCPVSLKGIPKGSQMN